MRRARTIIRQAQPTAYDDSEHAFTLVLFKHLEQLNMHPYEERNGSTQAWQKLADTLSAQDEFIKEGFTQDSDFETGGDDEDEERARH